MRPYGVKRKLLWKYPDKGDCLEIGSKSRFMKIKSKNRQFMRRVHKKKERNKVKKELWRLWEI